MYLQYGNNIQGFGVFANEVILKSKIVASYVGEICEIRNHTAQADSDYTYRIDSCVVSLLFWFWFLLNVPYFRQKGLLKLMELVNPILLDFSIIAAIQI